MIIVVFQAFPCRYKWKVLDWNSGFTHVIMGSHVQELRGKYNRLSSLKSQAVTANITVVPCVVLGGGGGAGRKKRLPAFIKTFYFLLVSRMLTFCTPPPLSPPPPPHPGSIPGYNTALDNVWILNSSKYIWKLKFDWQYITWYCIYGFHPPMSLNNIASTQYFARFHFWLSIKTSCIVLSMIL